MENHADCLINASMGIATCPIAEGALRKTADTKSRANREESLYVAELGIGQELNSVFAQKR
jgi:hypothetical protein